MDEGPYAGSATILLAPDFATLKVVDKRRHQRVAAALWAVGGSAGTVVGHEILLRAVACSSGLGAF